jgi:hypothetical protein
MGTKIQIRRGDENRPGGSTGIELCGSIQKQSTLKDALKDAHLEGLNEG